MNSADIREAFLQYFESKGHSRVASSSLVPGNDPTLLFTNAGMVQFKDVFLGLEQRDYSRATSSQRCVRAGGKHNDLENVGYTARHHTFFEMLGNFSFGDYFKRDAIAFAWEFLTGVLKLPPERLWVTVHVSDDEAADIWLNEIGVDGNRFSRLDEDNFWQMGDTGPCGPSSEIFYDHGPEVPGGPPGSEGDDLDRYIEIWNLVFMQYERNSAGELKPLPNPSIDTGMGLERISAVMQGVHSNYEIDLFQALIDAAAEAVGFSDREHTSLRVIADHIRSCSFLIADGVMPSNEGRGYVLRRIIRRAARHGHKLGQDKPFFHQLVAPLVAQMGAAYPELADKQAEVEKALLAEEEQFAKTLANGMAHLEAALEQLSGSEIPGEVVFTLSDTYGFPVDLTNDIARERQLTLDMPGYEACLAEQRQRSREASQFKLDYSALPHVAGETRFTGYDSTEGEGKVVALYREQQSVDEISEGDEVLVILDSTPFYAESGGQVGDSGYLDTASARIEVVDCQKQGSHHLHIGKVLRGSITLGQTLTARVDDQVRAATMRNHSATHLMHAALREILGDHVTQKGSLVDSERLRFDFSHPQPVSAEQLSRISQRVNQQVLGNSAVETELMSMSDAKAKGAMALFGEKYGDTVRVLTMGDGFSVELCGGTHVDRTGDIGLFRIVSESGVASGVRRIEAVTGQRALQQVDATESLVDQLAAQVKANRDNLADKVAQLVAREKALEKQVQQLKTKLATGGSQDLSAQAEDIAGVKLLAAAIDGADAQSLRVSLDQMKQKLGSAVILLAADADGKAVLVAGVTADLKDRFKAGDLMREVAPKVGGKGGGRPDMAQGGGTDPSGIPAALAAAKDWLQAQV